MPNVVLNSLHFDDSVKDEAGVFEIEGVCLARALKSVPAGFIAGDWGSQPVSFFFGCSVFSCYLICFLFF
jgi:hypothetical protein